jgi:hypothetical protein
MTRHHLDLEGKNEIAYVEMPKKSGTMTTET